MKTRALPDALRARLHFQLATLERAGVPPMQALDSLELGEPAQARVAHARRLLSAGQSLAAAGRLSALFSPMEAAVVAAAAEAGSPARAHQRLAEQANFRHEQLSRMRGRLMLPALVAFVALVVLPLPALVAGSLGVGSYLLRLLLIAGGSFGLLALGRELLRRQAGAEDWPGRAALEAFALELPLFGALITRWQVQRFVEHLALLLDCGLPAADAVRHAASTLRVQCIRSDFEASLPALQAGHSLQAVAGAWRFVADQSLVGMIGTGEASGRLPELLGRYAAAEGEALASRVDSVATWIPRIIYVLLALILASQLIGAFSAFLPRDVG